MNAPSAACCADEEEDEEGEAADMEGIASFLMLVKQREGREKG